MENRNEEPGKNDNSAEEYFQPPYILPSRIVHQAMAYLLGLLALGVMSIMANDKCVLGETLAGDLLSRVGLIGVLILPLILPVTAAIRDRDSRIFTALLISNLLSLPGFLVFLFWHAGHDWNVHGLPSMSPILFPFIAGYLLICSIIAIGVFFTVRKFRR